MIDFTQRGKQPQRDLLLGHLQAEKQGRHRLLAQHRRLRDGQRQRCLAQRRSAGQDDQIAVLQPGGQVVEIGQPGGHAGHRVAASLPLAQPVDQFGAECLAHSQFVKIALIALLVDPEDFLLRFFQQFLCFPATRLQHAPCDPPSRARQLAQDGHVANDSGVGLNVGRAGRTDQQIPDISGAASVIELFAGPEMLANGQIVAVLAVVDQIANRAENQAVVVARKIAAGQKVRHLIPGLVVQHEAAKQRTLGVNRRGKKIALSHLRRNPPPEPQPRRPIRRSQHPPLRPPAPIPERPRSCPRP